MNCNRCQAPLPEGMHQCLVCRQWTFHQIVDDEEATVPLSEVMSATKVRLSIGPWDPLFGGGIVSTSVTLIGGSPGAGKSTLMLQIGKEIVHKSKNTVLYISAEEEPGQLKSRADRLKIDEQERILLCDMLGNSDTEYMQNVIMGMKPKPSLVILDSLQGLIGSGPSHDNESIGVCNALKSIAAEYEIPAIIIDHITKADLFAGRMTLQHTVDCLIQFYVEDEASGLRTIETIKNRHGATPVKRQLRMQESGLVLSKGG